MIFSEEFLQNSISHRLVTTLIWGKFSSRIGPTFVTFFQLSLHVWLEKRQTVQVHPTTIGTMRDGTHISNNTMQVCPMLRKNTSTSKNTASKKIHFSTTHEGCFLQKDSKGSLEKVSNKQKKTLFCQE